MYQPAMLSPHTISRKRISGANYSFILVLLPDSRRIRVTLACFTFHPFSIVSKPELAIFQNILQVFFVSRQADCIAGKIQKPSFQVKNPWLKSRASDSPSGFFSLATRLRLQFYLLSCFICPMHCLPAVSYSDSLSASLR